MYTYQVPSLDYVFGNLSNNFSMSNPRFTLADKGGYYEGSYPVPGARREDIKVSVKNQSLEVSYSPEKENHYAGAFNFSWSTKGLDTDSIKAAYVDGVLTITVQKQKKPEPQVKTIQVV